MTELLEMKQRLKIFYGKYDVYLKPALKFLLALFAFFMINEQIGFMQKLSGPAVSLSPQSMTACVVSLRVKTSASTPTGR